MAYVAVTGAAGFLGSHLVEHLLDNGHEVLALDNMLGADPKTLTEIVEQHLQEGKPSRLFPRLYDCADLSNLNVLASELRSCSVVYHLAAAPHEGLSVFSPCVVTQHTYFSTVVMATAAIKAGVKRFVFASSMSRYGSMSYLGWGLEAAKFGKYAPFVEADKTYPVDPYGIAKVAAEDVLRVLAVQHGMEHVIAVPHNIVGPRQKYDDPYRNVASIFANLMLQDRQPYIYGDGQQQRVFSDVADCVPILARLGFEPNLDGEIFNIGPDDNPVTILELAKLLAGIIGFALRPTFLPDRPCEVKHAWPSADKARQRLGYDPKIGLTETLERLVAYIQDKGAKPFRYHLPVEIVNQKTPRTWSEKLL